MDEATLLSASNISEVILSLLLIVVSVVAVGWLFGRMHGLRTPSGQIVKVIAGQSLGSRERLVLVSIAEKRLLLGITATQIQTLLVLDGPETDLLLEETPGAEGFKVRLRQALGGTPQWRRS